MGPFYSKASVSQFSLTFYAEEGLLNRQSKLPILPKLKQQDKGKTPELRSPRNMQRTMNMTQLQCRGTTMTINRQPVQGDRWADTARLSCSGAVETVGSCPGQPGPSPILPRQQLTTAHNSSPTAGQQLRRCDRAFQQFLLASFVFRQAPCISCARIIFLLQTTDVVLPLCSLLCCAAAVLYDRANKYGSTDLMTIAFDSPSSSVKPLIIKRWLQRYYDRKTHVDTTGSETHAIFFSDMLPGFSWLLPLISSCSMRSHSFPKRMAVRTGKEQTCGQASTRETLGRKPPNICYGNTGDK